MKKIVLLVLILFFILTSLGVSQNQPLNINDTTNVNHVPFTPSEERLESYNQKLKLNENSLLKNLKFTSIGPTIMSGRVDDIDVSPFDPTIFYVAYASGGLWKTTNNGQSFNPLFDNESSMTIGDIAVDWKHGETIWVGTGEDNSSRSSYAGTGIYKSIDTGKTWQNRGLAETHHIGKIIINPDDPNTIWIAALGHLYSPNNERGIFKTTDGGKTWNQKLFVDENTGAIDLIIDPKNSNILYASFWYRTRRAWDFVESGSSSGIYKSEDAGETWELISSKESGFPAGDGVGRIGLAISNQNSQLIYAVVDNQSHRKDEEKEKPLLTKQTLKEISKENFLKLDEELINKYLDEKDFPEKYTAKKIIALVKEAKIKPSDLADYIEDANENLFDTPIIGAEVYKSTDGGKTWNKANEKYIDDMFFTYGYYFSEIRVDPSDDNKIYLLGFTALLSKDGGKTFKEISQENVHADNHALWINPNRKGHLILGNDGGLNISFDDGANWVKANTPAVGQFYSVAVDMEKPFNVYGGLQDNGVWMGPSNYNYSSEWQMSGEYPYKSLLGGDGMQLAVDTTDNNTVYTGYQFGYYYRINKKENKYDLIKPIHELGERPFRFNWQTPIHLSNFNHDIFYIGSNKLHRSFNNGDDYDIISPDLTLGGIKGDVPFGTLTSIDESPFKFGLIYTGSDDGLIYLTRDGGNSWKNISSGLPKKLWVSRVSASLHDTATVYVSLNGYRWDDFNSYVYKSTNFGETWVKIGNDLPAEPVNVIKEDPVNKNIIYVGTDNGLYASIDRGESFMGMTNNLPFVPVHDLVVHPRDKKLVVGTHGRSIYLADVSQFEKLDENILSKKLFVFDVENINYNDKWGIRNYAWTKAGEPKMQIVYYSNKPGIANIKIKNNDGDLLNELSDSTEQSLNYLDYDLSVTEKEIDSYKEFINDNLEKNKKDKFKETDTKKVYLRPGEYKIEIEINGTKETKTFEVKPQKKKVRGSEEKLL